MITKLTHRLPLPARLRALLLFSLTLGVRPRLAAVDNEQSDVPPDPTAFELHLSTLYNELRAARPSPKWTREEDRRVVGQIEDAVTGYIAGRLNSSPRATAQVIEHEVNDAMTKAIYESVYGLSAEEIGRASNRPRWAFVLEDPKASLGLCVAGFVVGYGNRYAYAIDGFAERNRRYEVAVRTGSEFDDRLVTPYRLKSFGKHELRFLLQGAYIGSPEALTKIVVYKFDGVKLMELWSENSVPNAKVSFVETLVVIYSYDQGSPKTPAPWKSSRTYYAQAPNGLKLLKVEQGQVR